MTEGTLGTCQYSKLAHTLHDCITNHGAYLSESWQPLASSSAEARDVNCPLHGDDPEPEGDYVGIGRSGTLSALDCICAKPSSTAEGAQPKVQQWNGTVQPNGTVYSDKTIIELMRSELAQSRAEWELMRKRLYDAGLDTVLDQKEVLELSKIKRTAYPVYLDEPTPPVTISAGEPEQQKIK
jgi:hypothetical protein